MIHRRQALLALAGTALAGAARAQSDYPNRAIRLLVPFSAGGSPDLVGRLLAQHVSKQVGQPFVIDNRLGANGIVASEVVAKAPADGYTLLLTTGSHVINPSIYKSLPYDTFADFAPVSLLTVAPALTLVVSPKFPAKTIGEFLAMARKPDSKLTYGSPGIGNTLHLSGELLNATGGTHLLHVPYKGASLALNAVMSGEVSACFLSTTAAVLAVKAGQVRPLAVTSAKRIASFPDVPTLQEAGVPGIDYNGGWMGIFAPGKTPRPVVQKLTAEFARALQVPEVKDQMMAWDTPPLGAGPEEFGKFLQAESEKFARIVQLAHVPKQ
jgi:tripartite-type tricarboxylate transporter receptor subunit TctC